MRYTGFSWMRIVCVRSRFILCEKGSLSLNTRCGRGRACFVVVGKIGAFISDRFQWFLSDISSLPRRNATGVVCIFLIWGIDDVYNDLFPVKPLTVTCAGLSMSLVLVVVFLVVGDSSERKVLTMYPNCRVVYRGGTGSFFGIGILPVSDLLDFRYFGRYH